MTLRAIPFVVAGSFILGQRAFAPLAVVIWGREILISFAVKLAVIFRIGLGRSEFHTILPNQNISVAMKTMNITQRPAMINISSAWSSVGGLLSRQD